MNKQKKQIMSKSKTTTLSVQVNGTEHTVEVTKNKKEYAVAIDGQEYKTFSLGKNSFFGQIPHEDFPIEVQGEQYILALRMEDLQLVKNGKYIATDEDCKPAEPLPMWVWIFVAANLALILVGGVIGGAMGGAVAFACLMFARGNAPTSKIMMVLGGMTIAIWLAYLFIIAPLLIWAFS